MDLINQFINNYKRKYNYYETASRLAAGQAEAALQASGIRAMVIYRAKNPARLKGKLVQRNEQREFPYKTIQEIYNDVPDLSGVRISLYFPGDRDKVDTLINSQFEVQDIKKFPGQSRPPSYNKRFSGYWASHYRVTMRDENLGGQQKKYASARIEIQVASVLMHAWSEVEHDLVYKPLQGTLSDDELAILDELNGLVLSGEIALERLQKAGDERIKSKNTTFSSQYDLASYLYNHLSTRYKQQEIDSRMGNVELLFKLLGRLKLTSVKAIEPILKSFKMVKNDKRTISQQIIDQIIFGSEKRYHIYQEVQQGVSADMPATGDLNLAAAHFLLLWLDLESRLSKITNSTNPKARGAFSFNNLKRLKLFNTATMQQIIELRNVRNQLIHGIHIPDENTIIKYTDTIQSILTNLEDSLTEPSS